MFSSKLFTFPKIKLKILEIIKIYQYNPKLNFLKLFGSISKQIINNHIFAYYLYHIEFLLDP